MKSSKLTNAFLTGCDSNTEWMLSWFVKHYKKHNTTPIIFADFGISKEMKAMLPQLGFDHIITMSGNNKGWFYKPSSMIKANEYATNVCWIDTDIHILNDMSSVFKYIETEKLAMCEDRGWSKRGGEKWHNSGVVAFRNVPRILEEWALNCSLNAARGDQEVLHGMINESPLTRLKYITDLPHVYNWLRLDLIDGLDSSAKLAMHWTGQKGKLQIKKMMYNEQ